jgi:hypothetical protein
MAAEVLSQSGFCAEEYFRVDVFEAMPSPGRKFLVAGKGGLNLTHSEPFEQFLSRYGQRRAELEPFLRQFGPDELIRWVHELGFETFVGSSGRVFPTPDEVRGRPLPGPAARILIAWLARLRTNGVRFHLRHRWLGWDESGSLRFQTPQGELSVQARAVILALGGGSWKRTGSSGEWIELLRQRGVRVQPLKPANCGFNVAWSDHFRQRFAGQPVKSVGMTFRASNEPGFQRQGEMVATEYGLEGNLIYAASAALRDEIEVNGAATILLDLAPDWSLERLERSLQRPGRKRSLSSRLERVAGMKGVKAGLVRECLGVEDLADPERLARALKALPVRLLSPRPIDEAISSAGGVSFEAIDERLMLHTLPGVFCAGEMLDWEAPTGGYLLTGCFSTGRAAGMGLVEWLRSKP